MIELYNADNTTYTRHGDAILAPSSCEVTAELNGPWGLSLFHPLDQEGRWRAIVPGAVIRAASFNGSQLFRIRETGKTDAGVTAEADPIFMDARGDCFILSTHPTNATGQAALTALCANNAKYSGISDITAEATAYFERRNLIDAIAGASPSFLERWGGEILFDNFTIRINERVGADYGVRVLYGRNIAGINEVINTDDVITRIVPVAYNGYMLTGSTPWVDSPNINSYPTIKTSEIKYDHIKLAQDVTGEPNEGDSVYNTLAEVRTALTAAAEADFAAGVDAPAVSLSIDMILLQNTEQYKDFVDLETVSLGDTVHCQHSRLGITSDARVVALKYDSLREAVTAVTLSSTEKTIFKQFATAAQAVRKALREDGSVVAEQIAGFIDGATTQLRIQNTVAQHQDVRAILFEDLDSTSPTFGALSIGTQGLEISRQRTADGRDWVWTTAITAEGVIASTLIAQETLAVAKHFFADASGVHVTEEEYDATDGNNVLITGNGVDIRDGTTSLSLFGSTARIGKSDSSRVEITDSATNFYASENGGLTARISYQAATTTTGLIAYGGRRIVSAGNGFTVPLRHYPTEMPLTLEWNLINSSGITQMGFSLSIPADTDVTSTFTNGAITFRYRTASNSLRVTIANDNVTDCNVIVNGTYIDSSPRFVFGVGVATAANAFAEGEGTQATAETAHAAGLGTSALGTASFASGFGSIAQGNYSAAFGENTEALGGAAIAAGESSRASGAKAAAFGITAVASGRAALSAGYGTVASGDDSAALGSGTTASGAGSFAAGAGATATSTGAVALGQETIASTYGQTVVGRHNATNTDARFIVGNGTSGSRSNAFTVLNSGDAIVANDLTVRGKATAAGDIKGARFFPGTVAIPSGANLNGRVYCQVGQYKCDSAGTLTNCPTSNYFTMTVISHQAADPTASNGVTVYRHLVDSTGAEWVQRLTWSSGSVSSSTAWRKIISEDASGNIAISNDLSVGGAATIAGDLTADRLFEGWADIPNGANINTTTFYRNGVYICASNTIAASLTNCPTQVYFMMIVKNFYNAEPSDSSVTVMRTIIDGNRRVYIQRRSKSGGSWSGTAWTMPENLLINNTGETIAPTTITFTPSSGTSYSSYGGCYYYKVGKRVHVHLGISGLTANTLTTAYTMPAGYRPATMHSSAGYAGRTSSATRAITGYIGSDGVITITCATTSGMIDFDYIAGS